MARLEETRIDYVRAKGFVYIQTDLPHAGTLLHNYIEGTLLRQQLKHTWADFGGMECTNPLTNTV